MRVLALLFLGFLLLSGCAQQAGEAPPPPAPPAQAPPAAPPPANATPPPVPPEVGGNITEQPPPNVTNESGNGTANETEPEELEGLLFGNGAFKLVLDDVSVVPVSEDPCGIFSVRKASDDSIYEKMLICPGDSQTWTSPDDHVYRIKVIKVAAGYSKGGNWVEVIIYG